MCQQCDYESLLKAAAMRITDNRIQVLEVIGSNHYPLSADNIYHTLERHTAINRVTVYRILELLVDNGLIERLSTGGRAFYYGLAPNHNHRPHSHFYCKKCGQMECLNPDSLTVDISPLGKIFTGKIDKVEIRVDGICKNCLK